MIEDPFSAMLSLVDAHTVISGGFTAGGQWAIRFPPPDKIKFYVITRGQCWMRSEGEKEAVRIGTGDVLMVSAARAFVLASDLAQLPLAAETVFQHGAARFAAIGSGDDFALLGGHVKMNSQGGDMLMGNLPPLIHVPGSSAEAVTLQWLVSRLTHEQGAGMPGAGFAGRQLAQLMFLEVLRSYFAGSQALSAGRLKAVTDPRLAPALSLLHQQPQRDWRLAELAKSVAMSRTAFAVYFKSIAGIAPLAYLTEWRMRLAQRALRSSRSTLAAIAESLGYASESSFSTAFKRVIGVSPKRYRDSFQHHL